MRVRIALTAAAAAGTALVIPTAAGAATVDESVPHMAPAISCSSWAIIGWNPGNAVYGEGTESCSRPLPELSRDVTVTLTRNGTAVEYGRHVCYGGGDPAVCNATTPAAANPSGTQKWCATSTATYDSLYSKTSTECWNG